VALTTSQYLALASTACTLTGLDSVTIADAGSNIGNFTAAQITALSGKLVDYIDASDNVIDLTAAQAAALGSVMIAAGDLATVRDTGANIANLSVAQISALSVGGIDAINATDNQIALTVNQVNALGVVIADGDFSSLVDTGAYIAQMTAAQFGSLGDKGVDTIDASNDVVSISVAQAKMLGSVIFTAPDLVTLADTASNIETLSASQSARLAQVGVDKVDPFNVTSDFNGDGHSDIVLQNKSDGSVFVWQMKVNPVGDIVWGSYGSIGGTPGTTWVAKGTGDFDYNGLSDFVFQNSSNGAVYLWEKGGPENSQSFDNTLLSGSGYAGGITNLGVDWKLVGTGDFNSDHKSDLVFQNARDGSVAVWEMNGTSILAYASLGSSQGPTMVAKGVGDFNGDGFSDVVLQSSVNGAVYVIQSDGTKPLGAVLAGSGVVGAPTGLGWQIKGVGDFNGDHMSDLLFQNTTNGSLFIWELDGTSTPMAGSGLVTLNGSPVVPGVDWVVKDTADFNGDAKSDVLFQSASTGAVAVWDMNGTSIDHFNAIGSFASTGWQVI